MTSVWYADDDGDGLGDPTRTWHTCPQPAGWADNPDDCDDHDAAVGALTRWVDADADGYGDPTTGAVLCAQYDGYALNGDDCDDGDPWTHPGADEVRCDGVDHDCDGVVDPTDCPTGDVAHLWGVRGGPFAAGDVDGDGLDDVGFWYDSAGFVTSSVLERPATEPTWDEVPGSLIAVLPPTVERGRDGASRGLWGVTEKLVEGSDGYGTSYDVPSGVAFVRSGSRRVSVGFGVGDGEDFVSALLGDLDGDGASDLLMNVRAGRAYEVRWVADASGGGTAIAQTDLDGASVAASGGDVDGDGRDDWVARTRDATALYVDVPDGVLPSPAAVLPSTNGRGIRLTDADGDGHADLVAWSGDAADVYTDPAGPPTTTWLLPGGAALHEQARGVFVVGWTGEVGAPALDAPLALGGAEVLADVGVPVAPAHAEGTVSGVADLGDLDGDGTGDIGVATSFQSPSGSELDLWRGDL